MNIKFAFLIILYLPFSMPLQSQDFNGTYKGEFKEKEAVLKMVLNEELVYVGTFVHSGGTEFEVEAYDIDKNQAEGYFFTDSMEFHAKFSLQTDGLLVDWVQVDENLKRIGEQTYKASLKRFNEKNPEMDFDDVINDSVEVDWNGKYFGSVNGKPATLIISQSGQDLTGDLNANNYPYLVMGQVTGNQFTGTFKDVKNKSRSNCSAVLHDGQLEMIVQLSNPQTGHIHDMKLNFAHSSVGEDNNDDMIDPIPQQLDPYLVGNWIKSNGDDPDLMVQLILDEDGTYRHGKGDMEPDDEGWSRGDWKSENSFLYIDKGQGWQIYGRYYVEENIMTMMFQNGRTEEWDRD